MAGPESVKEASLKAYAQGFDTDRPELVADPSLPSPNPNPHPNPDSDPRPDPNPNPSPDPDPDPDQVTASGVSLPERTASEHGSRPRRASR